MDKYILEGLIGQVVGLYPGDTYYKYGIIRKVDDTGILIEITRAHPRAGYKSGEVRFISHTCKLTLKTVGSDID